MKKSILCILCAIALVNAQEYRIKGPAEPKPYEATAVTEMTEYLGRRISGNLSVDGKSPITLYIGDTELAAKHNLLSTTLESEQWVIKSFGRDVVVNGGGTRGALYATYHFLEDLCGIHWWSEYEDYVPEASSLKLPKLDMSGKPALIYRDLYGTENNGKFGARNAIRNRLNRRGDLPIPAEYGGRFNYGPPYHTHTLDRYLPAAKHLAEHPEWFSFEHGRRVGGQSSGQLCLSHPDIVPMFSKFVLESIETATKEAKAEGVPAPMIYDLTENDNNHYCRCDKCAAFIKEHNPSGQYLMFVNGVARNVAKVHPEVYLSFCAYLYTEEPPKGLIDGKPIMAEPNVIVRVTNTSSNHAVSVLHPDNAFYKNIVERWKEHCGIIFASDYAVTFTRNIIDMPFPSEFHYADLFRFLRKNNVRGSFWEHEVPQKADMYELKFFKECKLMEDPDLDQDALMKEFMDKYYGAAGRHVLKYRQELNRVCKENHGVVKWFPALGDFNFMKDEDILRMQKLFDDACAAVADDELLLSRVYRARSNLDRLVCRRNGRLLYHGNNQPPPSKLDTEACLRRLQAHWVKWQERYGRGTVLKKEAQDEISTYSGGTMEMLPPPDFMKDRNYYEFYTSSLESHGARVERVDDPESPTGRAMRTTVAESHYYNMPFAIGFCDKGAEKNVMTTTYREIPEGAGYHWFKMGTVTIPQNSYVYLTRAWTTKLTTGLPQLIGKRFEIWASVKHVGPQFHPEQKGPEYIFVDRIILAEPIE